MSNKMEEENTTKNFNLEESLYLEMVHTTISQGIQSDNRTGVKTRSMFAPYTLHFDLSNNVVPVMTTRKTFFRGAVEELLWMLKGQTNANILKEKNVHIWDGNTTSEFIEKRGLSGVVPDGDIGTLYGYQLRNWGGDYQKWIKNGERTGIDQLSNVVELLRKDKSTRRAVVTMYNCDQLETGVLEPCHTLYIFYVNQKTNELYCHLTLRSWDLLCGAPINIIWTALFTRIVAELTGLKAGGVAFTGVNCHVYENHIVKFREQYYRDPYLFPKMHINAKIKEISDIDNLKYEDFELVGYESHLPIKYDMAI